MEPPEPSLSQDLEASMVFNGIDADTGDYFHSPMGPSELAQLVRSSPRYQPPGWNDPVDAEAAKGLAEDVDAGDLAKTGWGVIFPQDGDAAVQEALEELLRYRQTQAGCESPDRFRIFAGEKGYRVGESAAEFLDRCDLDPGPVDPDRMPYYLLLVGSPEEIPSEIQYGLDLQYAVGRLCFDAVEDYYQYAQGVLAVERGDIKLPRIAAFFAPKNPGDQATELSSRCLATPLAQASRRKGRSWEIREEIGEAATKERLQQLAGGGATPAFLFTAGHGLMYQAGDSRQRNAQGSLICQSWPGPGTPAKAEHFFAAADVPDEADVAGLVTFHFACFSAGTPALIDFPTEGKNGRSPLAPKPFISRLPQRLLAHPRGGALAVVGHMERAFGWSYRWVKEGRGLAAFEAVLGRLLSGKPIGHAMEHFNHTYGELSAALREEMNRPGGGSDRTLARLWTTLHDVRNYLVLGDPAVRLAAAPPAEEAS
ncbi:MAG TPA: hypothetical protein VF179_33430 [Thermoanaerobaculia bacterium]|nr:hypothetical protein [Thermoanaerobaculia bacterium]